MPKLFYTDSNFGIDAYKIKIKISKYGGTSVDKRDAQNINEKNLDGKIL